MAGVEAQGRYVYILVCRVGVCVQCSVCSSAAGRRASQTERRRAEGHARDERYSSENNMQTIARTRQARAGQQQRRFGGSDKGELIRSDEVLEETRER